MTHETIRTRATKIHNYAKPVAEKTGTYADIVWLCETLLSAVAVVEADTALPDDERHEMPRGCGRDDCIICPERKPKYERLEQARAVWRQLQGGGADQ